MNGSTAMSNREKITAYYKENEDYLGDNAQALSYLDDTQWAAVLLAGACGRCGRPLTVPSSIDRGIGPDCAALM